MKKLMLLLALSVAMGLQGAHLGPRELSLLPSLSGGIQGWPAPMPLSFPLQPLNPELVVSAEAESVWRGFFVDSIKGHEDTSQQAPGVPVMPTTMAQTTVAVPVPAERLETAEGLGAFFDANLRSGFDVEKIGTESTGFVEPKKSSPRMVGMRKVVTIPNVNGGPAETVNVLICGKCDQQSDLEGAINRHRSRCNPEKNTHYKYVCNIGSFCTMRFLKQGELDGHENLHTGVFKCKNCGADMKSTLLLREHKKTCKVRVTDTRRIVTISKANGDPAETVNVLTCGKCDQQSDLEGAINRHRSRCNPEKNTHYKHVCNMGPCNMRFLSSDGLEEHINLHTGVFKCESCDKDMESNPALKEHKKTCSARVAGIGRTVTISKANGDSAETVNVLICGKCDQQSDLEAAINRHRGKCNSKKNTHFKYVCKFIPCNMRFRYQGGLDGHENLHTGVFKCEPCNEYMESKTALKEHKKTCSVRVTDMRPTIMTMLKANGDTVETVNVMVCPKCDQQSDLEGAMRVHMRKCNPENNIHHIHHKHVCNMSPCTMWFSQAPDLEAHENLHTGVFKCGHCDEDMGSNALLKEHKKTCSARVTGMGRMVTISKANGDPAETVNVLICGTCDQKSDLISAMKRHMARCNPDENKNYAHRCGIGFCTMRFKRPVFLNEHENLHVGEFKCNGCNETMENNALLREHKRTCEDHAVISMQRDEKPQPTIKRYGRRRHRDEDETEKIIKERRINKTENEADVYRSVRELLEKPMIMTHDPIAAATATAIAVTNPVGMTMQD